MASQTLLEKIGFSLTFDTAIIGFLVVAAFFYGVSMGRKRMVVLLVATYMAYVLLSVTPYLGRVNLDPAREPLLRIGLFVIYILGCYLLLSGTRMGGLLHFSKMKGIKHWWQIFIFAFLQVGFWVSAVLTFFPEEIHLKIAPITGLLFTKDFALFIWFLAPILFVSFIRKKKQAGEEYRGDYPY